VVAPVAVGAIGAVTEVTTLRPLYRREPLYGLILTFGLALVFREGARQIWGGDMRRILPPFTGSTPLLGMTYPNYRLFLLAGRHPGSCSAIWLFFHATRAGILVRAAVQDAEMLDGLGVNVPRVFTLTFAGSAALAALAGLLLAPVFTVYPQMGVEMILLAFIVVILGRHGLDGRLGDRRVRHRARTEPADALDEPSARRDRDLRDHDRGPDHPAAGLLRREGVLE
jgi:branched-chain amino acid transport system permease protein